MTYTSMTYDRDSVKMTAEGPHCLPPPCLRRVRGGHCDARSWPTAWTSARPKSAWRQVVSCPEHAKRQAPGSRTRIFARVVQHRCRFTALFLPLLSPKRVGQGTSWESLRPYDFHMLRTRRLTPQLTTSCWTTTNKDRHLHLLKWLGDAGVWRCLLCFLAVNGLWAVMRWSLPPGPTGTSRFEPVPDRFQPGRNGPFTAHSSIFIEDLGLGRSGLLEARVGIEPA
jgi:hypothetical protein